MRAIQVPGRAVAGATSWPPGAMPPRKVRTRAPRIDARGRAEVLAEVEQHVDHARPHLPRRRERSGGYRSPTTFPLRPRARLTASANRIASPCTPPRARRASSPSTMKCPWSCWIEKWITRKRSTDARAMARRSAPNTRADRSDGSPGVARIVICTGHRGSILGRVAWGIEGRPRGFRPAPLRAPPQVLATASGSRICRLRPGLIARMFRCRRRRRWVAWLRPLDSGGCPSARVTSIRTRARHKTRAWNPNASAGSLPPDARKM